MIIENNLNIPLTKEQDEKLLQFSEKIYESNKKFNLTGFKDLEKIKNTLIYESIRSLDSINLPFSKNNCNVLDLGSGSGVPGIPLKIINNEIDLTLIESSKKKCTFISSVCKDLGLNVEVINDRAEIIAHDKSFREKFQIIISRGVGNLTTLAEITIPFAKIGGSIISIKGLNIYKEIIESESSVQLLGGEFSLYLTSSNYSTVVVWKKISSTPEKYPRRPGAPQKSPLRIK